MQEKEPRTMTISGPDGKDIVFILETERERMHREAMEHLGKRVESPKVIQKEPIDNNIVR